MILESHSYFHLLKFFLLAEITAFSDRYEEFEKLNTEILGVSIDSVVSSLVYSKKCLYLSAYSKL